MHKLKIYMLSSLSILLSLISCKEKPLDRKALSGIFINKSKQQYAIVRDDKVIYPSSLENHFEVQNENIKLNNEKYNPIKIDNQLKSFDSVKVSYNTDNYESVGIKEFDAKINQDSITFYDVENNVTKKIAIDKDFKKWFNISLDRRKMDIKNLDKRNHYMVGVIIYKDKKVNTIYSNAFNDPNNNLKLFMSILITYISINRDKAAEVKKTDGFTSLDSLNTFIDKNNIGMKRVPLPLPIGK